MLHTNCDIVIWLNKKYICRIHNGISTIVHLLFFFYYSPDTGESLFGCLIFLKSGISHFTEEMDVDFTTLVVNAMGHTNSNIMLTHFLKHYLGRPVPSRIDTLPKMITRITACKSLKHCCAYPIYCSLDYRLDRVDKLLIPLSLKEYLQSLKY